MPNPLAIAGLLFDLANLISQKNLIESFISLPLLGLSNQQQQYLTILGDLSIEIATSLVGGIPGIALKVGICLLKTLPCSSSSSKKMIPKAFEFYTKEDLLPILTESYLAMNTYTEIAIENYGNFITNLTSSSSLWLKSSFLPVISEFSQNGIYISSNEYQMLINGSSSNTWTSKSTYIDIVNNLVERFNNTQMFLANLSQG